MEKVTTQERDELRRLGWTQGTLPPIWWRYGMSPSQCFCQSEPRFQQDLAKVRIKLDTVRVIFRKFKEGGDIIALFPLELGTNDALTCQDYMHWGQHGSANYIHVIEMTTPATPGEYNDLLQELKRIGYDNIKVLQRAPSGHMQVRVDLLRQQD